MEDIGSGEAACGCTRVKSKTGTLNSSGGARLAGQMRLLRMRYRGAEIYSHSLVGNTLSGHRSMGGMLTVEPI